MKKITSNLQCPACHRGLQPQVLACGHCDIKVEGPFVLNEFATLSAEDLHFLRIFIASEGRIRDMEAPLGLSYPTIRARLRALRQRIVEPAAEVPAAEPTPETDATSVLERLGAGEIDFDQAMALLRAHKRSRER
jgi:hypothetical protein